MFKVHLPTLNRVDGKLFTVKQIAENCRSLFENLRANGRGSIHWIISARAEALEARETFYQQPSRLVF